ncbi:MAG: hypothetical protein K0R71_694 [Bacillales bacterium]|jgi:uncharacterized coiled-coil protein SlyX|nr:hypothetical protein [Bacillales bacterium]
MTANSATQTKEDITTSLIRIVGQVNRRVSDQEKQMKLIRDTLEILIEDIRDFEEKYQVTLSN